MNRIATLALALVALSVGAFALLRLGSIPWSLNHGGPLSDSVWYHESDVALLAATGRPQLLEFFHPD